MTQPLDGVELAAYFHKLNFPQETRDLLKHIRSSPPSRTPQAARGNSPVWYPSQKMQCIIKAESSKVEFPFLLTAEYDTEVLEIWDQPPSIQLEYKDVRGHLQRPNHTSDYFVFWKNRGEYIECKPIQEMEKLAQKQPNRYVLDENGAWRCPPGEAFAEKYGLSYRVWTSDKINWVIQDNALFLEDYLQDISQLELPEVAIKVLRALVKNEPGIPITDLQKKSGIKRDPINIAIIQHALYVDLASYRLAEPWSAPVFPNQKMAKIYIPPQKTTVNLTSPVSSKESMQITPKGQDLLDRAREQDIAKAILRNRVIHPEQYNDEEQKNIPFVPDRTKEYWRKLYRDAERLYGIGYIGLLPRTYNSGRKKIISSEMSKLIHDVLEENYDTVIQKPKRGSYGEYLKRSEEKKMSPVSQRTFYTQAKYHKATYDQVLAREGKRAAYPFKTYVQETERTISRHGSYAWSMAHIDHTELDIVLRDSRTGFVLGKCWLTLLILTQPRIVPALYVTFDPPSYRSNMMVLRLCVQQYQRLPSAVTVDGGKDFHCIYFDQLLALYKIRKHIRPALEPRYGSPQEKLFGTMDTQFIYHLIGNTQATKKARTMTKETNPFHHAIWTLPALAKQIQDWANKLYPNLSHPALGMTPHQAYDLSIERDGERVHKKIAYDDTFIKATLPSTRTGMGIVHPGSGVRINHLDYWCEAMRDPNVENTQVKVKYEPFNVSTAYAYIGGVWRKCISPFTEFYSCSERELQMLTEELRKKNSLHYRRENIEVTQKQLAEFRRENADIELLLRQRHNDRETRAAVQVLETRKQKSNSNSLAEEKPLPEQNIPIKGNTTGVRKKHRKQENTTENLLVFKRIRL